MTPTIRGWCPTLYEPMTTGDGLLARIKPPCGRLSADAARALAAAATQYGSGRLELTNRGALQVRGLSQHSLADFCDAAQAVGLASADPAAERRRNVMLTPLAGSRHLALAAELEGWLEQAEELSGLPPKFAFAVDDTQAGFEPLSADIRLAAEAGSWRVWLDGADVTALTDKPAQAAESLAKGFLGAASQIETSTRRMRDLIALAGGEAVLADAGLTVAGAAPVAGKRSRSVVGWLGQPIQSVGLGLAFGALDSNGLTAAASLAERYADGWLRTSPWRALMLAGVAKSATPQLAAAAVEAGFIIEPDDPRLAVSACVGRPGCASAFAATRADAEILAAERASWLQDGVHLSGCPKGCAHPASAAVTLMGGPDGYDLVRHGRASDPPERRGLSLMQAVRLLNEECPRTL